MKSHIWHSLAINRALTLVVQFPLQPPLLFPHYHFNTALPNFTKEKIPYMSSSEIITALELQAIVAANY